MASNFVQLALITLLASLQVWLCHGQGCWEQEKLALLRLKPLFDDPFLQESWSENENSSDCCQWRSVECDATTGRVIGLSLSFDSSRVLYLNSSVFLSFQELKSLDLSSNRIAGFFDDQGLEGHFNNLETLDLSNNQLNESVLWSLGRFSSLKSLNLQGNAFSSEGIEKVSRLTSLEILNLGYNQINYTVLSYIVALPSLKSLILDNSQFKGKINLEDELNSRSLESLSFGGSAIRKSFLLTIGSLNSLKVLSLPGCLLSGPLPAEGICKLIQLTELDISRNNFSGNLPWCFSNLKSLEHFDLSSNQFSGNIAMSPLQTLTSIQFLGLSNNQFQIPTSLSPFFNLSNLKAIFADSNQVYNDDRDELYSLVPTFQLNTIHMSCCGNGGAIPAFLYHQHDLQEVDLSSINLSGGFPNWLLENNTGLTSLSLRNNSLTSSMQMPFRPHKNLSSLDISDNRFHGYLEEIGTYLPELNSLNISENSFIGRLPLSFGDMKSLQFLDASNNELSGEIPEHFAMGCDSLMHLILSNNQMEGPVFPRTSNWRLLGTLRLAGNRFSGEIPESIMNCSLGGLDISNNNLYGKIPRWLGNMTDLETIIMGNNSFDGPIPEELCQLSSLTVLDLSRNNLSGSMLPCSFSWINQLHLSGNMLQGSLTSIICNYSSDIVALNLGENYFTGKIPSCINQLPELSFLLLNKNNLEGEIPRTLCNLTRLGILDLSHNKLSGQIPACLNIVSLEESSRDEVPGPNAYSPDLPVGFRTKGLFYFYEGNILSYMSGIDLSSNDLTGEIPNEVGSLVKIRALNISHNRLVGQIPPTLSNLVLMESLDCSYNNLSGEIPPQLVNLNSLSSFSVAHNNLSGRAPARVGQFGTFDMESYDGNPLLCGVPLPQICSITDESALGTPEGPTPSYVGFIDIDVFYISFIVSFMVVLLGIAVVLYINPYWRRAWFYYIELACHACYCILVDCFSKLFCSKLQQNS